MRLVICALILLALSACAPVAGDPYTQAGAAAGAIQASEVARSATAEAFAAHGTQQAALATAQGDAIAMAAYGTQTALDAQREAINLQGTAQALSMARVSFDATQTAVPAQATASATAAQATAAVVANQQRIDEKQKELALNIATGVFWLLLFVSVLALIIIFPTAVKITGTWADAKSDEMRRHSLVREGPGGLALVFLQNTYVPALDAGRLLERSISAVQVPPRVTSWKPAEKKQDEPPTEYIDISPVVTRGEILRFIQDACKSGDVGSNIIPGWRKMKTVDDYWNSTPWQSAIALLKEQGFVETDPGKDTRVIHGTLADLRNQIVFRGRVPEPLEMANF